MDAENQTPETKLDSKKRVVSQLWTQSYGGYDLHVTPNSRQLERATPESMVAVSISITPHGSRRREGEKAREPFGGVVPHSVPVLHQVLVPRGALDRGFSEIINERLDAVFNPLLGDNGVLTNPPANTQDYVRVSDIIVQKLDEAYPAAHDLESVGLYTSPGVSRGR